MYIRNQVDDSAIIVGTDSLKKGVVLELDANGKYKRLEDVAKADAILLADIVPTEAGIVAPVAVGGVIESATDIILPSGIVIADIKAVLRTKGIYIRGVNNG
jgi:hypothetical protein